MPATKEQDPMACFLIPKLDLDVKAWGLPSGIYSLQLQGVRHSIVELLVGQQ